MMPSRSSVCIYAAAQSTPILSCHPSRVQHYFPRQKRALVSSFQSWSDSHPHSNSSGASQHRGATDLRYASASLQLFSSDPF